MLTAIKYNLANLTNFRGRDGRSTFWFYILFLVIAQIAISFVVSIAMTGPMMGDLFAAAQHGASETEIQQRVYDRMEGMMRASAWTSAVITLIMIGLVIASFTRRLHDSNKPGWIAALTAVIQLAGVALQIASIDKAVEVISVIQDGDVTKIQEAQSTLMANGLVSWIPLILVIVFGAWPSSDGDNRYGPEPDHL